jgi:hypothetical protein
VIIFFAIVIDSPLAYWYFSIPPTCSDGSQNQGETSIDKGGPCPMLDARSLAPSATLWSRAFLVRDGSYNAVAYIQNPNDAAGALDVPYTIGLYDASNILIAERHGTADIMPGGITPIFEGSIDTGRRIAVHTYLQFSGTLPWERLSNAAHAITVGNIQMENAGTAPRLSATVTNASVDDIKDIRSIAVVFDPAGNAFAASQTALDGLAGDEARTIVFTWPDPFPTKVGRIDITPVVRPASAL